MAVANYMSVRDLPLYNLIKDGITIPTVSSDLEFIDLSKKDDFMCFYDYRGKQLAGLLRGYTKDGEEGYGIRQDYNQTYAMLEDPLIQYVCYGQPIAMANGYTYVIYHDYNHYKALNSNTVETINYNFKKISENFKQLTEKVEQGVQYVRNGETYNVKFNSDNYLDRRIDIKFYRLGNQETIKVYQLMIKATTDREPFSIAADIIPLDTDIQVIYVPHIPKPDQIWEVATINITKP